MHGITFRRLTKAEELRKVEGLQKEVWGMVDVEVVPTHMLMGILIAGGIAIGAFDEDGNMVGFVFGLPGVRDGKLIHHSHMLGVKPELRHSGVGYRLKLLQREAAMEQGVEFVEWTFDPLQGANAKLNFAKLGVISRTYFRDVYGEIRDSINIGYPSDRLLVEWWVKSLRVVKRISKELRPLIASILLSRGAEAAIETVGGKPVAKKTVSSRVVVLPIPGDINRLRRAHPELASEWRMATREAFERLFSLGYIAVDFSSELYEGGRRNAYILLKATLDEALSGRNL
jgi:predicted GNAT superfamily acetyltransferase